MQGESYPPPLSSVFCVQKLKQSPDGARVLVGVCLHEESMGLLTTLKRGHPSAHPVGRRVRRSEGSSPGAEER